MMNTIDEDVRRAQKGMNVLMSLQNENLIEIRGGKSDVNIISTFVLVFAKFKCVNRLALFTQDVKLAKQINALNNDDIGGFNILFIKYFGDTGIQKWEQSDIVNNNKFEGETKYLRYDLEKQFSSEFDGWGTIE